jgi:acyl CoA:acetate/3-ketoacid CoA transferase beta subunit
MNYTNSEMQAYTIARMIKPDQVVIVGTGFAAYRDNSGKKDFST